MQKIKLSILLILFLSSCESFLHPDPPQNELPSDKVFQSDASATAALLNIYGTFASQSDYISNGWSYGLSYWGGLLADEYIHYRLEAEASTQFYYNNILSTNGFVSSVWSSSYRIIYNANAALEGLETSAGVTPALKTQLKGEALFLRAFAHFFLGCLYSDVPYVKTTDFEVNAKVSRMPVGEVFHNVIADLVEAESLMGENYVTAGRVRPNKWVAAALLARVYLYAGEWAKAEQKASEIITHNSVYSLEPLDNIFLTTSKEAIWQLLPEWDGKRYADEGALYILTTTPEYVSLQPDLVAAFESGDERKTHWIGQITVGNKTYDFPYKYKENYENATGAEYTVVFRLAEQYLIRAEARAQQNKIEDAQDDLDEIRSRAGLGGTTANTRQQLLDAIFNERRIEFFSEWGHRWLDMKRTKRADAIMAPIKTGWSSNDTLFPLPNTEILRNTHLTQNEGYD